MTHDPSIPLYSWMLDRFVTEAPRAVEAIDVIGPHLAELVAPGDRVLDLCCGAGPWSFFFEEQGAAVCGIDFAPYMIERARSDGARRQSAVEFIQADVLAHDFGEDRFDLVVLLGNTIADLAPADFLSLLPKIHRTLAAGGAFAMQYIDGVLYYEAERFSADRVEQEEPVRLVRRFKEYRPEHAAWVMTYTNEATDETCDYTSYLYPVGLLRVMMEPRFTLIGSTPVGERSVLDVFSKQPD